MRSTHRSSPLRDFGNVLLDRRLPRASACRSETGIGSDLLPGMTTRCLVSAQGTAVATVNLVPGRHTVACRRERRPVRAAPKLCRRPPCSHVRPPSVEPAHDECSERNSMPDSPRKKSVQAELEQTYPHLAYNIQLCSVPLAQRPGSASDVLPRRHSELQLKTGFYEGNSMMPESRSSSGVLLMVSAEDHVSPSSLLRISCVLP